MGTGTTPVAIRQEGNDVLCIEWEDGRSSHYEVRSLRLACRCARCIEEWTGQPLLQERDVPLDVRPVQITSVGRYAIQIQWSDGHDTGIYAFDYLLQLDEASKEQRDPQ